MKLIRFGAPGEERPGILLDGHRRDCSAHFQDWNREFFLNDGLTRLSKLVDTLGSSLPGVEEEVRWGAPIARPGMIMCVGLNYADHAKESGMEIPAEPVVFGKASNTIAGPYDDVKIPKGSEKTDWEVELGVVLCKDVSYLNNEDQAREAIAGFCVVHDLSERAFQLEQGGQWIKGKSAPGFCPTGPYLVTLDELDNPANLWMKLSVNGVLRQDGNTSTMVFRPDYVVWYLSQFMLVEAGDLISTGTPPGVGLGMNPPQYLKPGDVVTMEIEGLGSQQQKFF